ncbi:hypothetical protein, partial [Pseudomonas koreensis]|uniref:hypothetical protein n=1 Tax=Pseudomonas koreensis TaxID=198620 RepID=UPI001E3A1304
VPTVGAAAGCDLLILILKNKIKRSQPSAAPTVRVSSSKFVFFYLKTTSICTESATAERYRYTLRQRPLCKALIRFSFSPRPEL